MNRTRSSISLVLAVFTLVVGLAFSAAASSSEIVADSIWINGNIYTVDKAFSKASILAVKDQKILYIGTDESVLDRLDPFTGNFPSRGL